MPLGGAAVSLEHRGLEIKSVWTESERGRVCQRTRQVITDKRGGGVKEWYLNYVTQLRDDLDDSTVDTNIISHYLRAVCARRFASSRESSHTRLSERERERERETEKRSRMRWDVRETRDKKAESTHLYKREIYERSMCAHLDYCGRLTLFTGLLHTVACLIHTATSCR